MLFRNELFRYLSAVLFIAGVTSDDLAQTSGKVADDMIAIAMRTGSLPEGGAAMKLQRLEFASGSSDLTEDHKVYLDSVAGYIMQLPTMVLSIEGHTDNVGASETNLRMSKVRAAAVARYMVSIGFPEVNIRSVGYGEDRPLPEARKNSSEAERRMNRRVELRLLDERTGSKGEGYRIRRKDGTVITADFFGISRETGKLVYREPGKAVADMDLELVDSILPPEGPAIDVKKLQEFIHKEKEKVVSASTLNDGYEITGSDGSKVQATQLSVLEGSSLQYKDAGAAVKAMPLDAVESIRMPDGRFADLEKLRRDGTIAPMELLEVKLSDGRSMITPMIKRSEDGRTLMIADADGVFRDKSVDLGSVQVIRTGKGEYVDVEKLKTSGAVERLPLVSVTMVDGTRFRARPGAPVRKDRYISFPPIDPRDQATVVKCTGVAEIKSEQGTVLSKPNCKETFWDKFGKLSKPLEESFWYVGGGAYPFRVIAPGVPITLNYGNNLSKTWGMSDDAAPAGAGFQIGYEWAQPSNRMYYGRAMFEMGFNTAHFTKWTFGVGATIKKRIRVGIDLFTGRAIKQLDPFVPATQVTFGNATFAAGEEVKVRLRQGLFGIAPNVSYTVSLFGAINTRLHAGWYLGQPFSTTYYLKLKGNGQSVNLGPGNSKMTPNAQAYFGMGGPYASLQIILK